MLRRNPALFSRLFNSPLLIHPAKLEAVIAGISNRFGLEQTNLTEISGQTPISNRKEPGYQVSGTVAVIDIFGLLAHRGCFAADSSYILGYERIGKLLTTALADPSVKSILLQLDSPGGEVAGAFELAAQIKAANQIKPVKAVISSMAISAGYLLASAASEIALSETGIVGSIGVVMRHVDLSKMAEQDGVNITYIYAGERKIDGNVYQPLPSAVKGSFQNEIDKLYSLFVATVAEYRNLQPDQIRAQQAALFTGQDAITANLADRLATPDALINEMQHLTIDNRSSTMLTTATKPKATVIHQPQTAQQTKDTSSALWQQAITKQRLTKIDETTLATSNQPDANPANEHTNLWDTAIQKINGTG